MPEEMILSVAALSLPQSPTATAPSSEGAKASAKTAMIQSGTSGRPSPTVRTYPCLHRTREVAHSAGRSDKWLLDYLSLSQHGKIRRQARRRRRRGGTPILGTSTERASPTMRVPMPPLDN